MGSEMCIRDRFWGGPVLGSVRERPLSQIWTDPPAQLVRLRRREDRLREWADDTSNRGRPTSASPGHLDRVALGTLVEYRTLGG